MEANSRLEEVNNSHSSKLLYILISIIIVLAIITSILAGILLVDKNSKVAEDDDPEKIIKEENSIVTPTVIAPIASDSTTDSDELSADAILLTKECYSSYKDLKLMIPSSWECEVESFTDPHNDMTMIIKGNGIAITLSTLGRGGPCDGADYSECKTDAFLKNAKYDLKYIIENDETKEIFGGFRDGDGPWISIGWDNIKSQDLTPTQKAILTAIFS